MTSLQPLRYYWLSVVLHMRFSDVGLIEVSIKTRRHVGGILDSAAWRRKLILMLTNYFMWFTRS